MGEMPVLSGMVFCADCGAKLYQVRGRTLPQSEYMVCATYRKKGKEVCPSHQIRNSVLEELLLDGIRSLTAFAREHEDEFVEMVTKKKRAEVDRSLRDGLRHQGGDVCACDCLMFPAQFDHLWMVSFAVPFMGFYAQSVVLNLSFQ